MRMDTNVVGKWNKSCGLQKMIKKDIDYTRKW